MICYRMWMAKPYDRDGWFLFGFIPLYVRDRMRLDS